jgi:hypothetical protein
VKIEFSINSLPGNNDFSGLIKTILRYKIKEIKAIGQILGADNIIISSFGLI